MQLAVDREAPPGTDLLAHRFAGAPVRKKPHRQQPLFVQAALVDGRAAGQIEAEGKNQRQGKDPPFQAGE